MMIKYKNRFKQALDFTGFTSGKIHPTDIDAIIEIDNKYLIIFEVKKKGMQVPKGQQILFERLADCWQKTNGPAYVVYCEHDTNTDEIIHLLNTYTTKVYHDNVYISLKEEQYHPVIDSLKRIAQKHNITKLKVEQ